MKKLQREDCVPQRYLDRVKAFGNTKEDNERWRQERRLAFPRQHQQEVAVVNPLAALFAAYASDEEEEGMGGMGGKEEEEGNEGKVGQVEDEHEIDIDDDDMADEQQQLPSSPTKKPCRFFAKNGKCKFGAECTFAHQPSTATQTAKKKMKPTGVPPRFSKTSLLEKLFVKETQQEHQVLLECFHFLLARGT
ncbi:hypothetical protein BASA81_003649 [Batrachochytrium salamandrivorans]|nr:hypothetical protein BASA81_003649 [Batrachochytrium salamandrivorans]